MANVFKNMMGGGGGENPSPAGNDVPWWLKYAGKVVGVVAGIGKTFHALSLFTNEEKSRCHTYATKMLLNCLGGHP